jgi:hypothetical protein
MIKTKRNKIIAGSTAALSATLVASIGVGILLSSNSVNNNNNNNNNNGRDYAPINIDGGSNPFIDLDQERFFKPNELNTYDVSNDPFNGDFVMDTTKDVTVISKDNSNDLKIEYKDLNAIDVYNESLNKQSDYNVFNNVVFSAYANDNETYKNEENNITTYVVDKTITEDEFNNVKDINGNVVHKPAEASLALEGRLTRDNGRFATIDGHRPQESAPNGEGVYSFLLMKNGYVAGTNNNPFSIPENGDV